MRHEALSLAALLSLLVAPIIAPWQKSQQNERLVLDVQFESSKDYDITSAYAVRGWNTTEGRMKITVPTQQAKHGGRYGMQVAIVQAFTKNFHAQFSLPHFMPRMDHSAYKLTFWAKVDTNVPITPEVAFLDVDEGYEWVGGATLSLTSQWQHIAMEYVYTLPSHKGHEIQIAFLIGAGVCTFYFDDIQLYEADVPSPPPPSPPPPPNYLLWIDGEGGPKGVQTVTRAGTEGVMKHDLSSAAAAHTGSYGFEVTVSKVYEKDYHCMLSLPAFLVTDHERMYTLAFWAKVPIGEPGAPKPRPHVTFQDEDNDYAWISGEFVQLSAIWHRYEVNLVVPYTLRGHNVITNFMLGSQTGTYYFDDFEVTNRLFVSPPPSPPLPPPSPPPNVLLMLTLEDYVKGTVNPQAWPEGTMEVVVQSQAAAHSGKYGLMIKVTKAFESDWHAQVSLKPWTPIDTNHGYKFSFWARGAAASKGKDGRAVMMPKVVFQDADDSYTPVKQVSVPLTEDWRMYEADLSIPSFRRGHAMVINLWVGTTAGTYSFDDMQVDAVHQFLPPPPPPPIEAWRVSPPPPGTVALLGFEGTDDGVTSQQTARNGSWHVSVPDPRAAHTGGAGLYVEVDTPFGYAPIAQLLLPRYVPRAGKETLLHLSFYARAQKLKATDPTPTVTVAFVDLQSSETQLGTEVVQLSHSDWQMHYVVVDLKTEHVGHSIRPFLYVGEHRAIYHFDEFEYKEIEIEDGMQWLQAAPERIRHHRMGRFSVSFRDTDDWPIDYGSARIELQRHEFPFGVNLRTRRESGLTSTDYVWYLTQAAKLFWSGTIRQQMQWHEYEPAPGDVAASKREVSELLTWMSRQGWAAGSTSLFDGGHEAKDHWSNKLTCADLELHLRERLMRDLREGSGFGKKFARYEVWRDAMKHREWIMRCGESILFNSYRWAHQADSAAKLITSESDILSTQTLTNAEAYHNMVWEMKHNRDVPVGGIGVRACFRGEVDASTVKHRLDVLHEVQLPVYITDLSISGLDPAKHAYELEKFLRIAFSHPAVAGITLGDLWDKGNPEGNPGAGLYSSTKQKKPAAAKLEQLWGSEWTTSLDEGLHAAGTLEFEGFYGTYKYALRSGMRECAGEISLEQTEESKAPDYYAPVGGGPERSLVLRCNWKGHVHVPVWATPAIIAFLFVGCLLGCYRKNAEHMAAQREARDREMARTPDRAERGRSGGTKALKGRTGPARITVRT
jgi:endo-1,4-beta-xylanase